MSIKQNNVKDCLDKSAADLTNTFYINYVSMITRDLAKPMDAAKKMNPATVNLLANTSGKTGIMFYDFCADNTYGGKDLQRLSLTRTTSMCLENAHVFLHLKVMVPVLA